MEKRIYMRPDTAIANLLTEVIQETVPVRWSIENDDDIEANDAFFDDDTTDEGDDSFWDD